jgi:hypothetical protein
MRLDSVAMEAESINFITINKLADGKMSPNHTIQLIYNDKIGFLGWISPFTMRPSCNSY